MDFLDREHEIERLEHLSAQRDGALCVVWGRRRIGKTRLLVEWAKRAGGAYFVADESAVPLQRQRLAEAFATRVPGFADVEYRDWSTLFDRLARDASAARVRGPFVIDELPYLVAASPELPSVLQRFVDHGAKQARLVIALAGSSQRMMQGLVLGHDAPLYGRAREAFEVGPLPPSFLGVALGTRDPVEILESYGIWGGVPRYWELAREHGSLREAVDALVLAPHGVLHDEPMRLLMEELPPATSLRPILDAIGGGAHRVTEIASRIGSPATALARAMTRLVELGLVVRETPFGEPERSTKRALYRLADAFLRLWFALVAPKRALLAQVPRAARLALFDQRAPHLWAASWETLCRAAVPHLAAELGTAFGPAKRFWSGGGPEWDVVSESLDGETLLLGEVKWSKDTTRPALARIHASLAAKGTPPTRARAHIVRVVFVPAGSRKATLQKDGTHVVSARHVIDALSRHTE